MKIDCSKVVNFMPEKQRMCASFDNCSDCPLYSTNNSVGAACEIMVTFHTAKAIKIVQKWSDEHQQKTYADDFFEKFPNAPKKDDSTPATCWGKIYGTGVCEDDFDRITCEECWNRIMEDKQDEQ